MKVPTFAYREREATDAFEVHRALLLAERRNPKLRNNPQWLLQRMDAFEAFNNAFVAIP